MKHLYIFDIPSYSVKNGVGTYINQLVEMVRAWKDFQVSMIMLQTNAEAFFVGKHKGLEYLFFPMNGSIYFQDNAEYICKKLITCVKDTTDNIFILNYSPCEKLLQTLKLAFPLSKRIFVMHDLRCCWPLMGNLRTLCTNLNQETGIVGKLPIITQLLSNEMCQLEKADIIVCLCSDTLRFLHDYYKVPLEKLVIIPHSIEINKQLNSGKIKKLKKEKGLSDEIVLLSVGRVSKHKGYFDYLESFKQLLHKGHNCKWVIIGDLSYARRFKESASDVLSRIVLTGFLDTKDLYKWYQIADIGIIPSYFEQCSYVGLEMMANGLPVVASNGFGIRCMFQNQINALTASIGNKDNLTEFQNQLAICTIKLVEDKTLRQRLIENSFVKINEVYNLKTIQDAYKQLLC